jgi:hypothetical protein
MKTYWHRVRYDMRSLDFWIHNVMVGFIILLPFIYFALVFYIGS